MEATFGPLVRQRREDTITRLSAEWAGVVSLETVARLVYETFDELAARTAAVNFLPLLGERIARERLRALKVLRLDPRVRAPQLLFVCEHNAGRSQLAAALVVAFAGDGVGVWSAGSTPARALERHVATAIAELGVDEDWAVPDPAGMALERVRAVRYELSHRVIALLSDVLPELALRPARLP